MTAVEQEGSASLGRDQCAVERAKVWGQSGVARFTVSQKRTEA